MYFKIALRTRTKPEPEISAAALPPKVRTPLVLRYSHERTVSTTRNLNQGIIEHILYNLFLRVLEKGGGFAETSYSLGSLQLRI